jgi:transposase
MDVVYRCCCGLDVHKKMVVACLLSLDEQGQRHKQIRTFTTMTQELLALVDWLASADCTHVAMESTGVYWKPIFALLEGQFGVILANAQHLKAITTDSPQWKHSCLNSPRRGDRSDPCVVRPAIAVA